MRGELRPERLLDELSGAELARWQMFFDEKRNASDKFDYYFAQLTYAVMSLFDTPDAEPGDLLFRRDTKSAIDDTPAAVPAKVEPRKLMLAVAAGMGAKIIYKERI
ncbi:MAG: phage tail assembly protein T [Victivallaceae bacterium]|nr:phage tail assembly protein T [Victivallaceae bacterium]